MGGSGGGGPTSIDLSKLTKAAEDRLRQLAKPEHEFFSRVRRKIVRR